MKLKTKMSLVLGMTVLSITPVMQTKAINVLTYEDIKCTETTEWKEYQKLTSKERENLIEPVHCEEMRSLSAKQKVVGAPLITNPENAKTFDLRNVNGKNYVTSIKNQYTTGLCWAFAAASSIESSYLINTGQEIDISELHMGYSTSYQLKDGINPYGILLNGEGNDTIKNGANVFIVSNYLTQRRGVLTENKAGLLLTKDNYESKNYSTSGKLSDIKTKNEYNINDIIIYTSGNKCIDGTDKTGLNQIKKMVGSYGSVYATTYVQDDEMITISDTEYQANPNILYYDGNEANHAISIIGWDDDYPAEKFTSSAYGTPAGNGAWIVKNSYGTLAYLDSMKNIKYSKENNPFTYKVGDNGYYYISYYDSRICKSAMAVDNVEQSTDTITYSYTKPVTLGLTTNNSFITMTKYDKTTNDTELLDSFNVYMLEPGDKIQLYYGTSTDFSKSTLVAEKTATHTGYTNIKSTKKLTISNDEYYIFMKYIPTENNDYTPVNIIYTTYSSNSYKSDFYEDPNPKVGYSFYSLDNGQTWTDSIGDGVKISYNQKLLNFYTDISVFTTIKNYNISIATTTNNSPSIEDGGKIDVTLDLKNITGDIDTKIYNTNNQDVTNKFKISKDNNKYSIAVIVGTTVSGTYTAKFTYKDAIAEHTFKVISTAPKNILVDKITIQGKNEVIAGGYLVLDGIVSPTNATNKVLNWSSSNTKIATVDQEGIVTAITEGTTTITATATDGSNIKGSLTIKVIGKKNEQLSNNKDKENNNNQTKSPETGLKSITVILLITTLTSIIIYINIKKKNLFRRV